MLTTIFYIYLTGIVAQIGTGLVVCESTHGASRGECIAFATVTSPAWPAFAYYAIKGD